MLLEKSRKKWRGFPGRKSRHPPATAKTAHMSNSSSLYARFLRAKRGKRIPMDTKDTTCQIAMPGNKECPG